MRLCYLDALGFILLLLSLQCELDKQLLELLVTVINAKLLKTETHTHTQILVDSCALLVYGTHYTLHNARSEIRSFRERIFLSAVSAVCAAFICILTLNNEQTCEIYSAAQ